MMAFCNKISSQLRQSILNNTVRIQPAPAVQMLIPIRSLSSAKLFVGGLPFGTDDQQLKEAFSSFGSVTNAQVILDRDTGKSRGFGYGLLVVEFPFCYDAAQVILDRDTGKSRGFGFVNFENIEDASTALSGLDGQDLNGRKLSISYASDNRRPGRSVNRGTGVNEGGSGGQGEQ